MVRLVIVLTAVFGMLCVTTPARGQAEIATHRMQYEITPFGGYIFGGGINTTEGEVRLANSGNFGVIVGIPMIRFPGAEFELSYTRQPTRATRQGGSFEADERLFDMAVEFWHAGILQEFAHASSVRPFALISLGATAYKPEGDGLSNEWLFSFAVAGGAKYMFHERAGLRLQARGLWSVVTSSTSFLCGGGGCFIAATGNAVFQVDLTAGVVLAF